MDIKQLIKISKMIHECDYDSAKKICQKYIYEYLEYDNFHGFDKFNFDLNMAGTADIGDDMLEQYKREYELEGYKSKFVYTFKLSKYSDTSGDKMWDEQTKKQILCYLIGKPYCTSKPIIIDNYYSIKDGAYKIIVVDKERCTIIFDLEKIA